MSHKTKFLHKNVLITNKVDKDKQNKNINNEERSTIRNKFKTKR